MVRNNGVLEHNHIVPDFFTVASDKLYNNFFVGTGFIQNLRAVGYASRTVLKRI